MANVSWPAFQRLFACDRAGIRVALDWERLAALHRQGLVTIVHEDATLDRLPPTHEYYTPWYADGTGRPTDYRAPDAHPLRAADLAHNGRALSPAQHGQVTHFERVLPRSGCRLLLPVIDLGGDRRLVLDGNHRLVALLRHVAVGGSFRIAEYRIVAPLDPHLLPDLGHWMAN
ncbi:hypothetical protein [Streptomyces sp. NPDC001714]|uniref:hypothetical protein n=1 Tax=Streptomyces sp. NPDC001714 TaxID=3364603 RepID=UPI0036ADCB08